MRENGVEMMRAEHLSARKAGADRVGKVAKPFGLFRVGLVMDPKDTRPLRPDQRLGGGHVRRDHIILDQALRFGLRPLDDRFWRAFGIENDTPLLQVEGQRLTCRARLAERLPRTEQVGQDRLVQFQLAGCHAAFVPGLDAVVGQPRGGTDQRALEAVRGDIAILVHRDDGDHGGARLVRAKRAQVV